MHFLGTNADLSSQTELTAIGKPGAGIDLNTGGIHLIKKAHGCLIFLSYNSLRMT